MFSVMLHNTLCCENKHLSQKITFKTKLVVICNKATKVTKALVTQTIVLLSCDKQNCHKFD